MPHIKDAVSRARAVLIGLLAAGLLAGCNGRPEMAIPNLPPIGAVPPIESSPNNATFALSKVIATIKRGTVTAHFPGSLTGSGGGTIICNTGSNRYWQMLWTSGRSYLGDWRNALGDIFYEVLTEKAFGIAGNPRDLFKRRDAVLSAEYLIGARVAEIRSNYCYHLSLDGLRHGYSGETYVKVEWTVFSSLSQQAIFVHENAGYHRIDETKTFGRSFLLQEAFADAALRLAENPDFRRIATREFRPRDASESYRDAILLPGGKINDRDLRDDLDAITSTVATIRLGRAHGSGFIVGAGGYLLTNAHLVGGASTVLVVLSNGVEVDGDVLRVNPTRDVALVKIPVRSPKSLPIRLRKTRPAERVYAVGGPAGEGIGATVMPGIISAHRTDPLNGNSFIQSDAALVERGQACVNALFQLHGLTTDALSRAARCLAPPAGPVNNAITHA